MFEMKINTEGSAFREPCTGKRSEMWEAIEINRILSNIQLQLEDGHTSGIIFDISGNRIGEWKR